MLRPRDTLLPAVFLVATLVAPPMAAASPDDADEMHVFGWIETVSLDGGTFQLEAKLDTGADNSSLHATDIEEFERDDAEWVRFTTADRDDQEQEFERPVERTASIRRTEGDPEERPVVKMDLCIGNVEREVEVNLTDRSALSYPMLIGRSYLRDHILVDSGPKNTVEPDCSDSDTE